MELGFPYIIGTELSIEKNLEIQSEYSPLENVHSLSWHHLAVWIECGKDERILKDSTIRILSLKSKVSIYLNVKEGIFFRMKIKVINERDHLTFYSIFI